MDTQLKNISLTVPAGSEKTFAFENVIMNERKGILKSLLFDRANLPANAKIDLSDVTGFNYIEPINIKTLNYERPIDLFIPASTLTLRIKNLSAAEFTIDITAQIIYN
ncbi:MAG: hypothetical protein JW917_00860 [Ignavibacteria bacterium]|nr:hypothetical protein [Ignavibacteria bacterium]